MTREEAHTLLEIMAINITGELATIENPVLTKQLEAIDTAIVALQNEVSHGEWIPVTDRLPEQSGQYLVFYHGILKDNFIDLMWYGKPLMPNKCISRKKKYFFRSDSEWGDVIYDEVIAWMPLPEPYKGE